MLKKLLKPIGKNKPAKPATPAIKTDIFASLSRGLLFGLSNFWRNKFLSFATIIVMAVIILIFNVILAIQHIGNQAMYSLSERVDIVIYLKDNIDFYSAKNLQDTIKEVEGVTTVKYTSKEEALNIVSKTHPKTADFLRKFNLQNPLPPSISITTNSPENHATIQELLQQPEYANLMENYITDEVTGESVILSAVAKNLQNIGKFVKQIIFWMVFVFILGGTLIIVNAIQLTIFHRKQEIHIMRIVGATHNFIRLPYIFEGILYGVSAVILSFIILLAVTDSLHLEQSNFLEYYQNINLMHVFTTELLITVILAVISSFSAVEQNIKGKLQLN